MENLSVDGAYIYCKIPIFGGINITQTAVSFFVVTVLLCVLFTVCGRNLKKRPGGRQVLVEKGVMMLRNMVSDTMGKHNLNWVPFIGTIFLSSLFGSLIGLTGIFRSATADISCVGVWAIMVSVLIWYHNIKNNGFLGWLKGFTEPVVVMTPMNIVSELAQPLAMAFRHFGNVAGGNVITAIIYTALSTASVAALNAIAKSGWAVAIILLAACVGLLWWNKKKKSLVKLAVGMISGLLAIGGILQLSGLLPGLPVLTYGIPAVLSCYFDLFSGFIQAYVFTLLTMVYISGALPGPKEEAAE